MVHPHVDAESVSDPFVRNGLMWMCVHKHRFLFPRQPSECDQKEIVSTRSFCTALSRESVLCTFLLGAEGQGDQRTVLRVTLFSPQVDLVLEIFKPGLTVGKPVCQLY